MDLSIPSSTTNSPLSTSLTPVFGDNVQDLLGTGTLNVNPTGIIVVNSDADTVDDPNSGIITLRDAINQANTDAGEDLIVFDRSVFTSPQTITLSGTELDITHNLDIIAPRDLLTGGDLVTVSGNKASRVFEIGTGVTVTLSGLIVADGQVKGDYYGGGIKNSGILTLDSSIVRNNSAIYTYDRNQLPYGEGGGIYNHANLTVTNSTISGNSAFNGGGIYSDGTLKVNNSTLNGNSAIFAGGGINSDGTSTVNNSTISGNSAVNGGGGGIYNEYSGTLTLLFSTVTQNQAANGGGVYQDDVGSFRPPVRGSTSVRNTIIASNFNNKNGVTPNVSGTLTSNGYNLIGDSTGSTGFDETIGDIVGTGDNPIDPRLAPLDFNGGSTQTIALLPDSPAIGAGDPTVLDTDSTTDQRGFPRRALDGSTDIGAFEFS